MDGISIWCFEVLIFDASRCPHPAKLEGGKMTSVEDPNKRHDVKRKNDTIRKRG